MQSEGAHPSWQYPHGTNSHDAQLPGSENVVYTPLRLVDVLVLGASVDMLDGLSGAAAGASVEAPLVCAALGDGDGASVAAGRHLGGTIPSFNIAVWSR